MRLGRTMLFALSAYGLLAPAEAQNTELDRFVGKDHLPDNERQRLGEPEIIVPSVGSLAPRLTLRLHGEWSLQAHKVKEPSVHYRRALRPDIDSYFITA